MRSASLVVCSLFLLLVGSAQAGPPCICHQFDIGDARSLPWGESEMGESRDYDLSKLVPDTLRILDESDSALVHAETLRRAAIYCDRNFKLEARLMLALMERVIDSDRRVKPIPLASFDAGYFGACLDELGSEIDVDAVGWMEQDIGRGDPGVALGAALVLSMQGKKGRVRARSHLRSILTMKTDDRVRLVRKNLATYAKREYDPVGRIVRELEKELATKGGK